MKKTGFTLVELIVVITILAVLGTIAFVSFQGYALKSRDSVRISDLTVMKKALELYKIRSDVYPAPSEISFDVSYSGALIWKQGVFAESVLQEIKSMGTVPTDPLTDGAYTYSRLNTAREFELGALLEGGIAFYRSNTSYAAGQNIGNAYVVGTYNGRMAKAQSGSTLYVLAVPTIINGTTELDYQNMVDNNTLVVKGSTNLPSGYIGSNYNTQAGTGSRAVNTALIYQTNDISTLTDPSAAGAIQRQAFLSSLQASYSGTIVANRSAIAPLLVEIVNENTIVTVINNDLGASIPVIASSGGGPGGGGICIFGSSNIGSCTFSN